jgi:hypothetical protein
VGWYMISPRHIQPLQAPTSSTSLSGDTLAVKMTNLSPLSMSQTKEELLKHLNLDPETYTLMAVGNIFSPVSVPLELKIYIWFMLSLTKLPEGDR